MGGSVVIEHGWYCDGQVGDVVGRRLREVGGEEEE